MTNRERAHTPGPWFVQIRSATDVRVTTDNPNTCIIGNWLPEFQRERNLNAALVAAAPDMHRYFVDQQHWLSDPQFNSSITLAQIAPGPNVLFVAILGWTLGVQAGGGMQAGPIAWAWWVLLGAGGPMERGQAYEN